MEVTQLITIILKESIDAFKIDNGQRFTIDHEDRSGIKVLKELESLNLISIKANQSGWQVKKVHELGDSIYNLITNDRILKEAKRMIVEGGSEINEMSLVLYLPMAKSWVDSGNSFY